ncbi:uncharacterized protein N7500_003355 [Penicillium coprophilum]|uniref:uncharacterized protein n=1 Tax=Penicillium coprophilum TaxID=36646 RepID=UPI00239D274E|nr:uncharacterized protein N7500_003355 [Penicillium coprophilum]KAJ5170572.1 hypothetical protein N7500_003355 [Penicillium coprophilum]
MYNLLGHVALAFGPGVHVVSLLLLVLSLIDESGDDAFGDGEVEDTDEKEDSDEPDEEEISDASHVTDTLIIWPMSSRTASSQQLVPFTLQHQKPRP